MDNVYNIVNGLGSTKHMGYPHINLEEYIFPPRLMEQIDKTFVSDLVKANANLGIITNVMFEISGKMYTIKNMSYLTGLYNELKELDGVVKLSTTDKTIS